MDRAHADFLGNGNQNGGGEQQGGAVIHQHTHDNHEHIHHQQNDIFVGGKEIDHIYQGAGKILIDEVPAQHAHKEQHHHNDTSSGAGFLKNFRRVAPLHAPVDVNGHGNAIQG